MAKCLTRPTAVYMSLMRRVSPSAVQALMWVVVSSFPWQSMGAPPAAWPAQLSANQVVVKQPPL